MKSVRKILMLVLFTISALSTYASHQEGAYITYKWVSGNEYSIDVVFYRNCFGVTAPLNARVCYSSASTGYADSVFFPMNGSPVELPSVPYLPQMTTTCNGGSGFGVEKSHYTGNLTLPFAADDWVLSFTTPIASSFGTQPFVFGYYVSTKIDNLNYQDNSSIEFTTDPRFQYCVGWQMQEDYTGVDDDGDSLVFSIDTVLIDSVFCAPVPFTNPDPTSTVQFEPLASTVPYYIQPDDGYILFMPAQIQTGCIYIKAAEYRNGILINETTRYNIMYSTGSCLNVGIHEPNSGNAVHISPTLVTDKINISISDPETGYVATVADMCGKIVYSQKLPDNLHEQQLDIQFLNPGSYFILFQHPTNTAAVSRSRFVKTSTP